VSVPTVLPLLALLGLSVACGVEARARGASRGVLVIAVDALRADHVGALGYRRRTTPNLDALAAEGVVFEAAFAAAPIALPAHAGLVTGCEPYVAQRVFSEDLGAGRWSVPEAVPRLAVEFLAADYRTAAFFDDPEYGRRHGFERGFQKFVAASEDEVGTQAQVKRLVAWLRTVGDRPWFAYLHLADLERSWTEPAAVWERRFEPRAELDFVPPVANGSDTLFAVPSSHWRGDSRTLGEYEAAYDGHLHRLDLRLVELFQELRRLQSYDATTIAVVGTMGVQFGEAGLYLQSGLYSMADLRVPWILKPAKGALEGPAPPDRIDHVVSQIDVAPTLLALEGIAEPPGMHGVSQLEALTGSTSDPLRPYAFAACGLFSGCAVIGSTHMFEYVAPGRLASEGLRHSWFGSPRAEAGTEKVVRFYNWRREPFPPLRFTRAEGEAPLFHVYRQVAASWVENLHDARLILQHASFGEEALSDERVRELIELGFLSPEAEER